MRALWDSFKLKPKNKYSLEHLKYLYSILIKNPQITEQNRGVIIETLRQIAELLIWGDQHNAGFLDFFLEKNLLGFVLNILGQKTNKTVKIQLIQTLSILVENLKSQDAIYYLFSNNHINEFIIHRFDFSDEELLAYYISLLKTLSLKLDRSTVQFFFSSVENDFPLYTEAIKFFNHEESMIRIAVRTLTLNVFRVEDDLMRRYILDSTAVPYFANIVWFIRQQCLTLDKLLVKSNHETRRRLDDFVDELLDQLYYIHDIFSMGIEEMNAMLCDHLMRYLLVPLFIGSIVPALIVKVKSQSTPTEGESETATVEAEERINPVLALFLLAQVFNIYSYKPLVNPLASALIHPSPAADYTHLILSRPTPPPSLSTIGKRSSYSSSTTPNSSFRKFASTPNLEQMEKDAITNSNRGYLLPIRLLPHPSTQNHPSTAPSSPSPIVSSVVAAAASSPSAPDTNSPSANRKQTTPSRPLPPPPPLSRSASTTNLDETSHAAASTLPVSIPPPSLATSAPATAFPTPSHSPSSSPPATRKLSRSRRGNQIKEALLSNFDDDRTALAVVCLLYAVVKNQAIDRELLEIGGLFPYRLSRAKYLLDMLTGGKEQEKQQQQQQQQEAVMHARSKSDTHAVAAALHAMRNKADADGALDSPASPTQQDEEAPLASSPPSAADESMDSRTKRRKQKKLEGKDKINHESADSDAGIVTVPDSQQREFSRELISKLLHILVRSSQFRLVTLQMTLLMLKELVYSPDSPPRLTQSQLILLGEAYGNAIDCIKEHLIGSLGDIFLELFEEDLRTYKQVNFEMLIKDASMLLPVSGTSMSRLDLTRRLPSGEAEKTQKAIQQFLVLRELKYTLLRKKDDLLPLKQPIPPAIAARDSITINVDATPNPDSPIGYPPTGGTDTQTCTFNSTSSTTNTPPTSSITVMFSVGITHPKDKTKKVRRYLVLYPQVQVLVVVDPGIPPKAAFPVLGLVTHVAPLQSLETEVDHTDACIMQVISHPTTWSTTMIFDDAASCATAKEVIDSARNLVRSSKMVQIYALLGESATDSRAPLGSESEDGGKDTSDENSEVDFEESNKHRLSSIAEYPGSTESTSGNPSPVSSSPLKSSSIGSGIAGRAFPRTRSESSAATLVLSSLDVDSSPLSTRSPIVRSYATDDISIPRIIIPNTSTTSTDSPGGISPMSHNSPRVHVDSHPLLSSGSITQPPESSPMSFSSAPDAIDDALSSDVSSIASSPANVAAADIVSLDHHFEELAIDTVEPFVVSTKDPTHELQSNGADTERKNEIDEDAPIPIDSSQVVVPESSSVEASVDTAATFPSETTSTPVLESNGTDDSQTNNGTEEGAPVDSPPPAVPESDTVETLDSTPVLESNGTDDSQANDIEANATVPIDSTPAAPESSGDNGNYEAAAKESKANGEVEVDEAPEASKPVAAGSKARGKKTKAKGKGKGKRR